jgi:hypothetical protein
LLIKIIDTYASEYGWTSDYILDHVYLDEFFYQSELISQRKRQHYLMLTNIVWLSQSDDKRARQDFVDSLIADSRIIVNKEIKTDFKAIEAAKKRLYGQK